MIHNITLPYKQGYIETEINGHRTYRNIKTGILIDDEPAPTFAELREKAYNNDKIISWEGKLLTVTEAATQWAYYAAENSAIAQELTELIIEAKTSIREKYPD